MSASNSSNNNSVASKGSPTKIPAKETQGNAGNSTPSWRKGISETSLSSKLIPKIDTSPSKELVTNQKKALDFNVHPKPTKSTNTPSTTPSTSSNPSTPTATNPNTQSSNASNSSQSTTVKTVVKKVVKKVVQKKKCPKCQFLNLLTAKLCQSCGVTLAMSNNMLKMEDPLKLKTLNQVNKTKQQIQKREELKEKTINSPRTRELVQKKPALLLRTDSEKQINAALKTKLVNQTKLLFEEEGKKKTHFQAF